MTDKNKSQSSNLANTKKSAKKPESQPADPEMMRAKPLILPDKSFRRDYVLQKPKNNDEIRFQGSNGEKKKKKPQAQANLQATITSKFLLVCY